MCVIKEMSPPWMRRNGYYRADGLQVCDCLVLVRAGVPSS